MMQTNSVRDHLQQYTKSKDKWIVNSVPLKYSKLPLSNMSSKEEMGYERELKILKEADHPFLIEYIEEFPYKN
jgi:hypothetical protein